MGNTMKSCIEQSEAKNTPRRSAHTVSAPAQSDSDSSYEEKIKMVVSIGGESFNLKTEKQSNMMDAVNGNAQLIEAVQSLSLESIPPSVMPEKEDTPSSTRIDAKGENGNERKSSENVKEARSALN